MQSDGQQAENPTEPVKKLQFRDETRFSAQNVNNYTINFQKRLVDSIGTWRFPVAPRARIRLDASG
jgi:hypothetical protein